LITAEWKKVAEEVGCTGELFYLVYYRFFFSIKSLLVPKVK
jgi:hypothetical protein